MPPKAANMMMKKKSTDIIGKKKRLYAERSTEPYTEQFMHTDTKKHPNDCHKSSTTGRLFPLGKEWDDESREKMGDVMELINDYFIWESDDEDPKNPGIKLPVNMFIVVRWCTLTVQAALRSWKTTLKKKYYDQWKNASPQQRDHIVFDRITRNEWEDFVKYIDNPDKKVVQAKGCGNDASGFTNARLIQCNSVKRFTDLKPFES
ncbi:uncharacterized protein A4U43_C03F13410 [Asparagus officinalis]|uniref:Uncharacterized protein n=1 Tax=Asparagus officinalis TaxID=4686 RepID=A0A5P1FDY3_ASPOF|nr:uncharacterized protein A4U43_C03F13410 [Asparagus officinalis]